MDVESNHLSVFAMKFIKQEQHLDIDDVDADLLVSSSLTLPRHGKLLPSSIRCLIVGPSNCGKTNLMMRLLTHPHGLRFENIYIYSKSLFQPKYRYLEQVLKPIKGLGYYAYNENENIIQPSQAQPNSIFIFDDIVCQKQQIIRDFFSMGRHNGVDAFYLCQTYSKIPKQLVRDNANMIVIFRMDDMNLKHVFTDHVMPDMSFDEFKKICRQCWNAKERGFVVIVKESPLDDGRYRQGFDCFIKV